MAPVRKRDSRPVPADALSRVNALLIRSERVLLSPEGLPRRPWFKHLLYAPGVYAAIQLALKEKVILVAFGDMLRVPVNVPKSEPHSARPGQGRRRRRAAHRQPH